MTIFELFAQIAPIADAVQWKVRKINGLSQEIEDMTDGQGSLETLRDTTKDELGQDCENTTEELQTAINQNQMEIRGAIIARQDLITDLLAETAQIQTLMASYVVSLQSPLLTAKQTYFGK